MRILLVNSKVRVPIDLYRPASGSGLPRFVTLERGYECKIYDADVETEPHKTLLYAY